MRSSAEVKVARLMDQILGHEKIAARFARAHKQNKLASTYIFGGPNAVGKRHFAWALAQILLCERSEDGCGVCGPCLRIEKQSSEGILFISPDGAQIKAEQCREVIRFLSLRGITRRRVVIMDDAHLMNDHAANALLKILEEPPSEAYLILVTSRPSMLLSTIRSRAQLIRFSPLPAEVLKKITQAEDWVIAASQGRVDLSQALTEGASQQLRQQAASVLAAAAGANDPLNLPKDLIKDRDTTLLSVALWQRLVRDALVSRAGCQNWINLDLMESVRFLAKINSAVLVRILQRALELERDILSNVDRSIACENFLVQARRLITGGPREVCFDVLD